MLEYPHEHEKIREQSYKYSRENILKRVHFTPVGFPVLAPVLGDSGSKDGILIVVWPTQGRLKNNKKLVPLHKRNSCQIVS
jgi:hypothetical protein